MALTSQVLTVGVNTAATGNTTIVAAPAAGQQILLRGLGLLINGATILTFNSQLNGMSFGPFNFSAAGQLVLPDLMPTEEADPYYTAFPAATALIINSSGTTIQISGYMRYSIA